ncbi:MAG: hypothetical protein L6R39_007671, partial [Caloplaca ligustica]
MHYSTVLSLLLTTFTLTPSILTTAIPKPLDLTPAAPNSDLAARTPANDDNDNDGGP